MRPGAAVWSVAFLAVGYYAGAGGEWDHVAILRRAHVVGAVALLVAFAVAYAFARRRVYRADGNHPLA
jgi:membrane protein DedA with SNARE-associated domain